MKVLIWNQQLSYIDSGGNKIAALSVVPHIDYLLTIHRNTADANNITFEWRLENLGDNTVQTHSSGSGLSAPPNANGFTWRLGNASTQFYHLQSSLIIHNGSNAQHQSTCQTWLKNAHAGTTTTENNETTTADSEWFIELDLVLENK